MSDSKTLEKREDEDNSQQKDPAEADKSCEITKNEPSTESKKEQTTDSNKFTAETDNKPYETKGNNEQTTDSLNKDTAEIDNKPYDTKGKNEQTTDSSNKDTAETDNKPYDTKGKNEQTTDTSNKDTAETDNKPYDTTGKNELSTESNKDEVNNKSSETTCSCKVTLETDNKPYETTGKNEQTTESNKESEGTNTSSTVFQFKIILRDTKPKIWRRIQVPKDFTFEQFHSTILQSMGWIGYHLHWFRFIDPDNKKVTLIRPLERSFAVDSVWLQFLLEDVNEGLEEKHEKLSSYFPRVKVAEYLYDLGNRWNHKVLFEGEVPKKEGKEYPRCTNGKRACPPEDSGGIPGYVKLCEILKNPQHVDYEDKKSWLKDILRKIDFNPDKFDPKDVVFKRDSSTVYQFKIILRDMKPKIWRRIQVPKEFSFAEFHSAILQSMGWHGYHLHFFRFFHPVKNVVIRPLGDTHAVDAMWLPFILQNENEGLEERFERLFDYFPRVKVAEYMYDLGDRWSHKILFEGEVPKKEGKSYPRCINGMRACPPDDCGGVPGYEELCEIMKNPQHEEYEDRKSWLKEAFRITDFNPEKFDPRNVVII